MTAYPVSDGAFEQHFDSDFVLDSRDDIRMHESVFGDPKKDPLKI